MSSPYLFIHVEESKGKLAGTFLSEKARGFKLSSMSNLIT
jgi:hypothetical protein